jgi:hypothetical protein
LKQQGLLDESADFSSVDQLLDGLERTSGRVGGVVQYAAARRPALREEWRAIREEARSLTPDRLPSGESLTSLWTQLKNRIGAPAEVDLRNVFDARAVCGAFSPTGARWLGASAMVGATRTGQVLAASLIEQYRATLHEIQEVGYADYAARQLRPYVRAAAAQFAPGKSTLTDRLLNRYRATPKRFQALLGTLGTSGTLGTYFAASTPRARRLRSS